MQPTENPIPSKEPVEPYKILFIDIETAPTVIHAWGAYDVNAVAVQKSWYILSFSIKWSGDKKPTTYALPDFPLYATQPENDRDLIKKLWDVLDEADLVIGHNSDKFDIKKINARMIYHNMPPPSPYKTLDTLKWLKRVAAFDINKLGHICKELGEGLKLRTGGIDLWFDCIRGDKAAWKKLKEYNARDVIITERLYLRLRPWMTTHPNITVKSGKDFHCPACGADKMHRRGWTYIKTYRAQRLVCTKCHRWSQGPHEKIPGKMLT